MDSTFFLIFRRMRTPLLALLVTYSIATIGLVVIPGQDEAGNVVHLSFFDAFYFISYTATTIGYGEIPYALTGAQRIWVTFCIYATVIVWIYSIGSLIALLQDKTLQRAMEEAVSAGVSAPCASPSISSAAMARRAAAWCAP